MLLLPLLYETAVTQGLRELSSVAQLENDAAGLKFMGMDLFLFFILLQQLIYCKR